HEGNLSHGDVSGGVIGTCSGMQPHDVHTCNTARPYTRRKRGRSSTQYNDKYANNSAGAAEILRATGRTETLKDHSARSATIAEPCTLAIGLCSTACGTGRWKRAECIACAASAV